MNLRNELVNDPLGRNYSSKGDVACAELLAEKNRQVVGSVSRPDFTIWAAAGPRAVIEDTALNVASPFRASALALRDFVNGSADSLDLANTAVQQLLTDWTTGELITQAQHDSLVALATHTVSRAEELEITDASANAVMEARK